MSIHQALWVMDGGEPTETVVSYLYPIIEDNAVDIGHAITFGQFYTWGPLEVDISHAMVSGVLTSVLSSYTRWPVENVNVATHDMISGVLTTVLKFYTFWPVESVDISHTMVAGTLTTVVFSYLNWPAENIDISHSMQGGTLT